ncbi:hypothetical protein [Micromonospora sp. NPDC049282]|uniref:hypothetical protein n=1 Tax=Micromonospora sp. NPDC049282 TaxID=3364269 RepID=UPI0037228182
MASRRTIYGDTGDGGVQLAASSDRDATATSSPSYCKDAVVFNTKQCWGFVTTTAAFADPRPHRP